MGDTKNFTNKETKMNKKELESIALRKVSEGKTRTEIVSELTNKGVDANIAATIANQATRRYT
jgi:hypothetical protein